jgi:hypothetical protein
MREGNNSGKLPGVSRITNTGLKKLSVDSSLKLLFLFHTIYQALKDREKKIKG